MPKQKKHPSSLLYQLRTFIHTHRFLLLGAAILVIALSLRFYNYPDRWGLGNDDARDIAIAQEALKRHELPLIGSFSSAGPFVFGPFFYWFIMGSYILLPFVFTAPWIFLVLFSVATVGVLMYIAYRLEGSTFAVIVGVIACLSPQLVLRSLTLGQHTFIAFLTSILILLLVLLYNKSSFLYALLFGLVLGSAINFHYQALNLLLFVPVLLFLPKRSLQTRIAHVVLAGGGIIIGLFPLLIWDSRQEFANFRNLLDYFLVGQHRLYVPNSWRLFFFTYLPQYWLLVIGGIKWVAFFLMVFTGAVFIYQFIRKKLPAIWLYLVIPFGILLFINRYYKGERSEGYLLYLLPLIILCTSYALYVVLKERTWRFSLNSVLAGGLLLLIIFGDFYLVHTFLSITSPVREIERSITVLQKMYPGKKFSVFDYQYLSPYQSQPLSILLSKKGLADRDGQPIGVVCSEKCVAHHPVVTSINGASVVDLSQEASLSAHKKEWVRLNPEDMYDDLIVWNQTHKLPSTFSPAEYFLKKFSE